MYSRVPQKSVGIISCRYILPEHKPKSTNLMCPFVVENVRFSCSQQYCGYLHFLRSSHCPASSLCNEVLIKDTLVKKWNNQPVDNAKLVQIPNGTDHFRHIEPAQAEWIDFKWYMCGEQTYFTLATGNRFILSRWNLRSPPQQNCMAKQR